MPAGSSVLEYFVDKLLDWLRTIHLCTTLSLHSFCFMHYSMFAAVFTANVNRTRPSTLFLVQRGIQTLFSNICCSSQLFHAGNIFAETNKRLQNHDDHHFNWFHLNGSFMFHWKWVSKLSHSQIIPILMIFLNNNNNRNIDINTFTIVIINKKEKH